MNEFLLPIGEAAGDGRAILAELFGADYSARALTPQRSDQAPDVVRRALARFAPFDSRAGLDLAGGWCVADHANAGAIRASTWDDAFEQLHALARTAYDSARFVVGLGGDHSVSWPLVTAAAEVVRLQHGPSGRLGVLQLDVHHDVRPLDDGPSNGTPFRGLIESGVLHPDDLVQVGIHPFGNRAHLAQWCDEQRIRRFPLAEVAELGPAETARAAIRALSGCDAIYLSVDIDVLDRAFAPGTAAALPGGLDPSTLVTIVETACADPRVIGMDVVEFDPQRDVADVTAYACANVVMAALAAVARRLGAPDRAQPMIDRLSPNKITFTRIALIPVLVPLLLVRESYDYGSQIAFGLFALLSLTDGVDGYVARSRNQITRLGIFLDPLADKLLVTAALVTLVELDEIDSWVVVLILSREFAVTGLRLIASGEGVVISAHWLGKLKTVAQIALVLALILPDTPSWLTIVLTVITVALTIGSGAEYFWKARHLLREEPRTRHGDGPHGEPSREPVVPAAAPHI